MNRQEALSIFDGVILSDGKLRRPHLSAYFNIALSGKSHVDWLLSIKEAMETIGVDVSPGYPKCSSRTSMFGKPYDYCELLTRSSHFTTYQHKRWYPYGTKEVPKDFIIDAVSLANWFMGDGNSQSFVNIPTVGVSLATHSFNKLSILILEDQLRKLGFNTGRANYKSRTTKGAGVQISILQNSVDSFMHLVESHIVPSYKYKVKLRTRRQ